MNCPCGAKLLLQWTWSIGSAIYPVRCPGCGAEHRLHATPPIEVYRLDSKGSWGVEIQRVPTLCERIKRVLPANATFHARRVDYYDEGEGPGARWALPEQIATSKFKSYGWQDEFRIMFCLTDALGFEKASCVW